MKEPPFTMLVDDGKHRTGNDRFRGFVPDVMNQLKEMLHFDYKLYLVPDGQFGAKMENGEWNGMIGEILAGVSSACFPSEWQYL